MVDASADNGTKTLSTLNKDAATIIVQHLASVLPVQFQDVKLVLAPSIRSLIQNSTDGQSCTLTCARNVFDDVAGRVRTSKNSPPPVSRCITDHVSLQLCGK